MKYNQLNVKSNKSKTRAGRGIAAGRGKTAGRGTKGQNSRSGGKRRPGFAGGQNPLLQTLPKNRGFKAIKKQMATVTTDQLEQLNSKSKGKIDFAQLKLNKVVSPKYSSYKVVLGKEPVKSKLDVEANAISATALEAIESKGGKFTKITYTDKQQNSKKK